LPARTVLSKSGACFIFFYFFLILFACVVFYLIALSCLVLSNIIMFDLIFHDSFRNIGQHTNITQIFDVETKTVDDFALGRHYARISSLTMSADGSSVISTSIDGLLKIWNSDMVIENRMPSPEPILNGTHRDKANPVYVIPNCTEAEIVCSSSATYQDSCVTILGRSDGTMTVCF